MLVSEDGFSIKAKNRIKKMVKLNILKKEQKLIKMRKAAGLWAKSQIHRQDAPGRQQDRPHGFKRQSPRCLVCAHLSRSDSHTQLKARRLWLKLITRRAPLSSGWAPFQEGGKSSSFSTMRRRNLPGP